MSADRGAAAMQPGNGAPALALGCHPVSGPRSRRERHFRRIPWVCAKDHDLWRRPLAGSVELSEQSELSVVEPAPSLLGGALHALLSFRSSELSLLPVMS